MSWIGKAADEHTIAAIKQIEMAVRYRDALQGPHGRGGIVGVLAQKLRVGQIGDGIDGNATRAAERYPTCVEELAIACQAVIAPRTGLPLVEPVANGLVMLV